MRKEPTPGQARSQQRKKARREQRGNGLAPITLEQAAMARWLLETQPRPRQQPAKYPPLPKVETPKESSRGNTVVIRGWR